MPSIGVDPIPRTEYPALQPFAGSPPPMPAQWNATVLLHPFGPEQTVDPKRATNPFFQLCVANVEYSAGGYFAAQVSGSQYGTWWYVVTPQGTKLSTDRGVTWEQVDVGWSLPEPTWFGHAQPACAGTSPLNWIEGGPVTEWWKSPVPIQKQLDAATWMWFDAGTRNPLRMMYGEGPPETVMGDPAQLPLFQMFSFTYFGEFSEGSADRATAWAEPQFPGLEFGNPGYNHFAFRPYFGMTAFMTPVNEQYNPLPTRVLYQWKPDDEYGGALADRAQNTLMEYDYNPGNVASVEALLTGPAPAGYPDPPADSDDSFLITNYSDGTPTGCVGPPHFDFPQEAPDWISGPEVDGTLWATITDHPLICPGTTVLIYSALFGPANPPNPNYPSQTYLWTWVSPLTADGSWSRPITFMQSQAGVGVGTSLALADYFFYEAFPGPIDPANFVVPPACAS